MPSNFNSLFSLPFSILGSNWHKEESLAERPKLEEFIAISSSQESENFYGTITSLNQDEGVINNKIYFTVNSHSSIKFRLGDHVHGEATRPNSYSAWRATKIYHVIEDWEDNNIENSVPHCVPLEDIPALVTGRVEAIHANLIALDNKITFYANEDNCSFTIVIGDWVQVVKEKNVTESPTATFPAQNISPLRQKNIHGYISHIRPNFFIINDEIFCFKSLLPSGSRVGDRVITQVIESCQSNYNWRGLSVARDQPLHPAMMFKDPSSWASHMQTLRSHQPTAVPLSICKDNPPSANRDMVLKVDSNCITLDDVGSSTFVGLWIENISLDRVRFLDAVKIHLGAPGPASRLSLDPSVTFPFRLGPQEKIPLIVSCHGNVEGTSTEWVVAEFRVEGGASFRVGCQIMVVVKATRGVGRGGQQDPLRPTGRMARIIQGEKPYHAAPFLSVKLPFVEVPPSLREAILKRESVLDVAPSLAEPLRIDNYVEKFANLLYLEEIAMQMEMRKFDIPLTALLPHGEFLSLRVEGLAENRPSLIIGDSVIVSTPDGVDDSGGVKYEGVIHHVLQSEVLVKFHHQFHAEYRGEDYAVELRGSRTPLRRCHLAVTQVVVQLGAPVLFPSRIRFQLPQIPLFEDPVGLLSKQEDTPSHTSEKSQSLSKKEAPPLGYRALQLKTDRPLVDAKGYYLPVCDLVTGPVRTPRIPPQIMWVNRSLNEEQRGAVRRILEGTTRPLPYVIFGPPGTGKTVTVVEALLQVYHMVPHSRILAVCPSNSAADLVAGRALTTGGLERGELVRLNAFNRSPESIPHDLQPHCASVEEARTVAWQRILVTTATTAGVLATARLRNGHYTHLFVDEAGQLTEPEIAIALGMVNSSSGQIVLAGDPKQLGPVVMSPIARYFGLGQSLLHRLCLSVLYQPHSPTFNTMYDEAGTQYPDSTPREEAATKHLLAAAAAMQVQERFEPRLVTLLVRSYRSHPDLLQLPSALFYHSRLVPSATDPVVMRFIGWEELPNPQCPLIFHPVWGYNQQEGDSPSWFNAAEAFQAARYVMSLRKLGVSGEDIGVISPYRKQVEKVRQVAAVLGVAEGIKVGSVEEFQGQERPAIIVSTVRTSAQLVKDDVTHQLGFLRCERRFNVALTRAQGLLVVVGHPQTLTGDPNWGAFLRYCVSKGAVKHEEGSNPLEEKQ